jgi:hypothetical protein
VRLYFRRPFRTSSQTFVFVLVIWIVFAYLGLLITRRSARFPSCLFSQGSTGSTTMDGGLGEPASLARSLAFAFPDTPLHLAHFSLEYYRDEIPDASSGALPWISKSLRLGDPPLPVLARHTFEAPAAAWLSSKCRTIYFERLVALESGQVPVSALLGELGRYVPPSISADGFRELCADVFTAYVQTCDALDLCLRLREMSADCVGAGGDEEAGDGVRRALEDLELQVCFMGFMCFLGFLGFICMACMDY